MLRIKGLDQHPAAAAGATGATGDLGQQRKAAFGGAKIGQIEDAVGAEHPDQTDAGKIMPLGDHLGTNQNIDLPRHHFIDQPLMGTLAAGGVAIHPRYPRAGEEFGQFLLQSLGAGPLRFDIQTMALGADFGRRFEIITIMTAHLALPLMKGQGDFTVRAVKAAAAIGAEQKGRKAAPVKQQQRLLAQLQRLLKRLNQGIRQGSIGQLLGQIDQLDGRHRPGVAAFFQCQVADNPLLAAIITAERRRGAAEQHRAALLLAAHQRQIAGVVAKPLPLFVAGLVLFVDDDQAGIL